MAVNGGKRWFVLAGLFLVSFLENGLARSFAVILDDLTAELGTSTANLGAVFGLVFGASYFLAFLTIPLLRRFSVRQLTLFGGLLSTLGLALSSLANTAPQFSAALSLFGLGYVLFISPTNSCPARYFPDRFGLATGILLSGGSTGVMLLPLLFEFLVNLYGWRGAVLVLGGINANMMVSGALLEPVTTDEQSPADIIKVTSNNVDGFINPAFDSQNEPRIDSHAPGNCDVERCDEDVVDDKEIDGRRNTDSGEVSQIAQHLEAANNKVVYRKHVIDDPDMPERNDSHKISNGINTICKGTEGNGTTEEINEKGVGPLSNQHDQETVNQIPDQVETGKRNVMNVLRTLVRYFELSLFKDHPLLIVVCIQAFLYGLSYSGWLLFVIPNAIAKGLPTYQAVQVSIAGGVCNFFGRLGGGLFSSEGYVKVEIWYYVVNLVTAAAFFINFIAESFWALMTLSAVYGVMIGTKAPAQFLLVMNATGKDRYSAGVSMLFLFVGLSFPVSGAFFGSIYDRTQSYNIAFCIVGLLDIIVAHITIMPRLRSVLCKAADNDQ